MRGSPHRVAPKGTVPFVEQLGAPSDTFGFAHADDIAGKGLWGLISKLKVMRDDAFEQIHGKNVFVEQLGVRGDGPFGLPSSADALNALMGLVARNSVTRYLGYDLRQMAYDAIETHALQLPIETKRKALLVTALYELAKRLPGR